MQTPGLLLKGQWLGPSSSQDKKMLYSAERLGPTFRAQDRGCYMPQLSSKANYKATWLCVFAMGCGGWGRSRAPLCAQAGQSCFRGHLPHCGRPTGHGDTVSGSWGSEAASQRPPCSLVGSVDT